MRTYVMFCFMDDVGGGQNYVNSKVRYLKKNGWNVIVFGASLHCSSVIPWENLKEFSDNRRKAFLYAPEFWSRKYVMQTLDWMKKIIGNQNQEIIIESHTDFFAEWGELLAQSMAAKHFCFLLDERLEYYRAKEFLYFKYLRNEVAGIHITSMNRLFRGCHTVENDPRYVLRAAHDGAVQNIDNPMVSGIKHCEWNIAYIGRSKQYEENIVSGLLQFAQRYSNKKIQCLVLGEINNIEPLKKCENLIVTELGFLTPIPRQFFKKIDVAIAGAGCAILSAKEGVPTIVADASSCLASGVLGYTTEDILFCQNSGTKFDDALELVLVKEICKELPFKPIVLGQLCDAFNKHFQFIEESCKIQEYFDFKKHPQERYAVWVRIKFLLKCYMPITTSFMKKLYGRIGKIYK